jgi:hypothetical protein
MPRGPHDDQIPEQDQENDHARQRLEQFRQPRFPASDQSQEPVEKNDDTVKREQSNPEEQCS